jgi:hypothetical protein
VRWTKGIPRTADRKGDLSAPAPKLPDGKPDLSGIWLGDQWNPAGHRSESARQRKTHPSRNVAVGARRLRRLKFRTETCLGRRLTPLIVPILKFFEADHIVGQHRPIALCKPVVV